MATEDHCMVDLSEAIDAPFDDDGSFDASQREVDDKLEGRGESQQQKPTIALGITSDNSNSFVAEQESGTVVKRLTVAPEKDNNFQPSKGPMDNSGAIKPASATTARRYFVPNSESDDDSDIEDDIQTKAKFHSSKEYQPPVRMDSSMWTELAIDVSKMPKGSYEIIFGVSIQGFHVDMVESITFYLFDTFDCFGREVIIGKELQRMCEPKNGIQRWKLLGELNLYSGLRICVAITAMDLASTIVNTGILELHYLELRLYQPEGYPDDSTLITHRPYLWSIDVRTIGHISEGDTRHAPEVIQALAISSDERYAATLASTDDEFTFVLTVWDLKPMIKADATTELAIMNKGQEGSTPHTPSYQPKAIAGRVVCIPRVTRDNQPDFQISISKDGSKVSVGELWDFFEPICPGTLSIHYHDQPSQYPQSIKPKAASTATTTLQPLMDYQLCKELDNFHGYGMFHIIDNKDSDIKKELFLAYDKVRILIFSVYPTWKHLHTITINSQLFGWYLMGIQGQFLAARHHEYSVATVWDIAFESHASIVHNHDSQVSKTDSVAFSADGNLVAMAVGEHTSVSLHWRATGTMLGSCTPPTAGFIVYNIRFIKDDTCILVYIRSDDILMTEEAIVILVSSMTIVSRVIIPQAYAGQITSRAGIGITTYSAHGATLDLVSPFIQPRIACTDQCMKDLKPLKDSPFIITDGQSVDFKAPSGLRYHLELTGYGDPNQNIIVSITDSDNAQLRTLVIPTTHMIFASTFVFLEASLRLVNAIPNQVLVWKLPASLEDDLELEIIQYVGMKRQWMTCVHSMMYSVAMNGQDDICYRAEILHSFKTVKEDLRNLYQIFSTQDAVAKRAILQCVNRHINSHCDSEYPSDTLMATFCRPREERWFEIAYRQFLLELLAFPGTRWILRPDTNLESNPLWICLESAKTDPRATRLVESIIDYCFCHARANEELGFLFPVLQCLHALVGSKGAHAVLGAQILRRFAYLTVRHQKYIVGHHIIAHPPEFRWRFWRPIERPLYLCEDPVLQLGNNYKYEALNKNFTRQLCIAPFALLWRYNGHAVHVSSRSSSWSRSPPSWIRMFFELIWNKCTLAADKDVQCHAFSLEMFDNPAIAALIEYKWNTIGFKYSMIRFFFQCCYYLLVLTVVFHQVYGGYHGTLLSTFIAVAVTSSIFLWLEFIQLVKSWEHYITSVYNIVDLFVFGLPLAASVNHFYIVSGRIQGETPEQGNAGFLSFSVLFIFLHFLFELRINRNVCKFVTIIINIFIRIRMFFFISVGGIIAFSIAILHLLRSCPFENCEETDPPTLFPQHFYGAVSATFFFMGGRYDSINDEMDSSNWAFHTMMIVFFFFTVILMLNVLIALINLAFVDGDETWRLEWLQNRLQVIESVENLTFHIPGFRQHYNCWFPNEIYYSVTAIEIENFKAEYPSDFIDPNPSTDTSEFNITLATEKPIQELKDELKQAREQISLMKGELQTALQEQSTAHQNQMNEIQAMLAILLKNKTSSP